MVASFLAEHASAARAREPSRETSGSAVKALKSSRRVLIFFPPNQRPKPKPEPAREQELGVFGARSSGVHPYTERTAGWLCAGTKGIGFRFLVEGRNAGDWHAKRSRSRRP